MINRIRRLLETANIKLGSVVSDITAKTARLILGEICRGNCAPEELAKLAQASLKNKRTKLICSLKGFYSEHFRWLLTEAMKDLSYLDRKLEPLDQQLAKRLLPYGDLIRRLCTIPGVDFTTAAVIRVGHEQISGCNSSGELGRAGPRQQRKRRQAVFRPHAERQPISAPRSDAKCVVDHPQERMLSNIVVLACGGA